MATYSFLDVSATLVGAGAVIDLGASAGASKEGITISPSGDKNTMTIGAGGQGMHSLHADKSGTVTIRLLKTSPTNTKLQALYDVQTLSSALHGQNVIVIRNSQSGDITTCQSCAFKKKPDLVYAEEGGMMEWTFDSTSIDTILGLFN